MRPRFPRRSAAAAATALVAALVTPGAAHGAPPSAPAVTSEAAAAAQRPPTTITLITGDKVTVAKGPKGTAPAVQVERAPGATGAVRVATEGRDTYVYPDEAMAYIATGRLDKQLFNVTQLMAQGYDDAHLGALPLIVTRTEGSAALKRRAELPGARTTLSLPSVRGEAVRTERSKAADFWAALTGSAQDGGQPSARLAAGADEADESGEEPRFSAGVDQVWLDGKAKATLSDTTAQVGAPAAWAAGGTGAGVRVAVLDSGADTTHPDLVDRIVATRSFVPGDDVIDRNGHGTHTASTVAGTGAASGGKEQGSRPAPTCWWARSSATTDPGRYPGSSPAWSGRRGPSTPRSSA